MNIIIIGAGLGGLTLARTLLVNGIKAQVYESESSPNDRNQGGLLDIHDYNGQLALKDCGLYEKFLDIIIPGADAHRILDKDGNILHEDLDRGNGSRPEVHRGELRQLLIDSLPSDSIKWGYKLSEVKTLENGKHELIFSNGNIVISDLLIGADGAWSKVRKLMTEVKPIYIGTSFLELYLFNIDQKHKIISKAIGDGTLMALAPYKGILGHKDSNGTFHAYIALNKSEEWIKSLELSNQEVAIRKIVNEFNDWAPELKSIILEAETQLTPRGIYALPIGHNWDRKNGVTLIGDAAHLMSPFAGEGANLALFDGAELGKKIVKNLEDIDTALKSYEEEMFIRSYKAAVESDQNSKLFFDENSPQCIVDLFTGFKARYTSL